MIKTATMVFILVEKRAVDVGKGKENTFQKETKILVVKIGQFESSKLRWPNHEN